jgi:FAD/FMN-containing dehydrogenase/Fe-S oxidoreductase
MPAIHDDALTRRLYANDASMYEELPRGVTFPHSRADLVALIRRVQEEDSSVTVRAAGTSLAGQATGGGIVADTSRYMHQIVEIDAENRRATVEPGVIRDQLNRAAAAYGLKFGPDTSTTNRCMMGGMIGNNSAGLYSIKYGSVRDHIVSVEAVLSDGSVAVFEPLNEAELEVKMAGDSLEGRIYRDTITLLKTHKEAIREAFPHPDIIRRNTGYALDKLCAMHPVTPGGRPFNMAELLCGSEGTLALMSRATVGLSELEPHRVLLIPHFDSLDEAMHATVRAVEHKPAAVELIDDIILGATEGNLEQQRNRFFLEGKPKCLLIIEFEGHDVAELELQAVALADALKREKLGYAFPLMTEADKMKRVWNLRKAGLGLLMGLSSDNQTPSFTEDTAVRVQDLPAYIRDFQAMMRRYDTSCVFYAHASVGELHLRPALNLATREGVDKMKAMAAEVAELVRSYRGSLSGEHGDGRARAPYIEQVIGGDMVDLLQKVKEIWDPHYRLNPGKIVAPKPIEDDLRYHPADPKPEYDTVFAWKKEGGFGQALKMCNGAGVCRKRAESGGTMCPSYMATLDEKDNTRGRANVFRQLFRERGPEAFSSEEVRDALKLCLSCKACKSECPANVDMARMKSEFMQGWHDQHHIPLATRFWTNPFPFLRLGALTPGLSNAIARSSAGHFILEYFANLHPERPLPAFAPQSFSARMASYYNSGKGDGARGETQESGPEVLLLVDPFTDLHRPEQAEAAWKVLRGLGCRMMRPLVAPTGRTQISGGLPKEAIRVMKALLPKLHEAARRDVWIVGLEPSELLTLRDEYAELCTPAEGHQVAEIVEKALLFEEFISRVMPPEAVAGHINGKRKPVLVHGHCYVKALTGTAELMSCLRTAGYAPEEVDSGCCGMAGSFGYQRDSYEVSMQIGEQRLFPAVRALPETGLICAHGFSCHHQIKDGTGRGSYHPAELLEQAMRGSFEC